METLLLDDKNVLDQPPNPNHLVYSLYSNNINQVELF